MSMTAPKRPALWRLALTWLQRDLRAGELTVMAIALVVAVAAMSSVGFFTDRVRQALDRETDQLLAADLVLNGDQPIAANVRQEAARRGLALADTATFPSMAQAGELAQLATLKAVSAAYPLRGEVKLRVGNHIESVRRPPLPGTAWADARLLGALRVQPGNWITIGAHRVRIVAELQREPDGAMDLYNFIPRLIFHADDLPATGLIQPGSRVRYRLLMAGEARTVRDMRTWLAPQLQRGQRLEDVREARPEIQQSLTRAERFLRLAALVSVFLAAAAIALAARRYVERHLDAVALLRTLGLAQRDIVRLFLMQYGLLALAAIALGLAAGWAAQCVLAQALVGFFETALPTASGWPALAGAGIGVTLLFGFCLPPLLRLRQVSPLRVLRRDTMPTGNAAVASVLGMFALGGLVVWQAGEVRLAVLVLGGLAGTVLLAALAALALLWCLPRVPLQGSPGWQFGLRNVARRRGLSTAQIVALSLGLMALLLLTVVRNDLFAAWERSVPADAPNRFAINIQPDQRAAFQAGFTQVGLPAPVLQPMVRARLVAINDQPMDPARYPEDRARRLAEREFNLSWGESLRSDNRLIAGRPLDDTRPGWSVEDGIAKVLGIRIGDRLTYDIAGTRFTAPVVNLREVRWDSFRVNFFVVGSSVLLRDQPASYITSFHLPADRAAFANQLVQRFNNVSIIDISAILAEVRGMLQKALVAVEVVFVFSLAAGLAVLYAATLATHDERRREVALLRTFGASRALVRQVVSAELLLLGGLAGLLAAGAALALGWVAASWLFDLPPRLSWWLLPAGALGGAWAVRLAAAPLLGRVLNTPPLRALR
jgi:putative ABC transport system permease protein